MKYTFVFLVLLTSCSLFKKKNVDHEPPTMIRSSITNPNTFFKYNLDFPEKNIKEDKDVYVEDKFAEGGERFGRIIKGRKHGKWLSGDADFDKKGNVYAKGKIWREEYFKNGLRDSIYKRFDNNGKIIYETTFKKGTGLWKEFHSNGKLYFEMHTKDGYFTDTLRLFDDKGKIVGKRLYKKDSLIYSEGLPCFPYRPESVPSD
ncbi:toxin-antitoxin system YwqK family antitoxin [Chryseobacterium jejuense]|uniref:MORN repeat variant n=1 Tax=Chryseobacterium jejuense TaxID=445960 RepID=A0A2X2YZD3_CHRJE|nr:hypothetical protein [Chryseobacterium jejuense]SDJ93645.1 MORN repeat variant [Chryseobacterium jejuense]SQB43019.1 MORN repeat variant [Chryseobacterium jejuense]